LPVSEVGRRWPRSARVRYYGYSPQLILLLPSTDYYHLRQLHVPPPCTLSHCLESSIISSMRAIYKQKQHNSNPIRSIRAV